jgi:hypothetical protein
VTLQDRILLKAPKTIQQTFHTLNPNGTWSESAAMRFPWHRLDQSTDAFDVTPKTDSVLAMRTISPSFVSADHSERLPTGSTVTAVDDDGQFGYLKVSPLGTSSNVVFLQALLPTSSSNWEFKADVRPIDPGASQRGLVLPLSQDIKENWIYNLSGTSTAVGDFVLDGSSSDEVAIVRYENNSSVRRFAVIGKARLLDGKGRRVLMDLRAASCAALEVALTGNRADLSGTTTPQGAAIYAPAITEVRLNGSPLKWHRAGDMVVIGD